VRETYFPGPKEIYITEPANRLTDSLVAESYVGIQQISHIEYSIQVYVKFTVLKCNLFLCFTLSFPHYMFRLHITILIFTYRHTTAATKRHFPIWEDSLHGIVLINRHRGTPQRQINRL
jgi:hypothetical protein